LKAGRRTSNITTKTDPLIIQVEREACIRYHNIIGWRNNVRSLEHGRPTS
jgi:hypothetical protein